MSSEEKTQGLPEAYREILDAEVPGRNGTRIGSHPRMSMEKRAAQFLPFQALTGFGDVIEDRGRVLDELRELTEESRQELDEELARLMELPLSRRMVAVTCFVPDETKDGGLYEEKTGILKKADPLEKQILLADGTAIPLAYILSLHRREG